MAWVYEEDTEVVTEDNEIKEKEELSKINKIMKKNIEKIKTRSR